MQGLIRKEITDIIDKEILTFLSNKDTLIIEDMIEYAEQLGFINDNFKEIVKNFKSLLDDIYPDDKEKGKQVTKNFLIKVQKEYTDLIMFSINTLKEAQCIDVEVGDKIVINKGIYFKELNLIFSYPHRNKTTEDLNTLFIKDLKYIYPEIFKTKDKIKEND